MGRVLIIDDSATVVQAVRAALAQDGHEVDSVDLFVRLPGVLTERPPQLILLDLEMPGVSGLRLGKLLGSLTKFPTPVCLYSSRPINELAAVAREIGAAAFLEKSRPMHELRRLVSDLLRRGARVRQA